MFSFNVHPPVASSKYQKLFLPSVHPSVEFLLYNFLSEDPGWGSCSLGVFICLDCSGIHRNIPDISKVKSLNLSHWEDHELQVRPQILNFGWSDVGDPFKPNFKASFTSLM